MQKIFKIRHRLIFENFPGYLTFFTSEEIGDIDFFNAAS